jgi:hypothetical protein
MHWRFAVAPASLMWSLFVVPGDPGIEVSLQLLEGGNLGFAWALLASSAFNRLRVVSRS